MAGGDTALWWLDNIGNDVMVAACDLRRWLTQRDKGEKRLRWKPLSATAKVGPAVAEVPAAAEAA